MIDEISITDFLDSLSSKAPVPGGGGASALCGALGVALGGMVSNLTLGKKKYADVQDRVEAILPKSESLKYELAALIDEDARAFYPLSQAYALPRDTPEQRRYRDGVMGKALAGASAVPLRIMEKSLECLELLEELAKIGSRLAVSDVGVGAQLCRSALLGAAMNVFINTKLMINRAEADTLNRRANALMALGVEKADGIYRDVLAQIT